ncbi:MAG: prepilin-type N-terminal cleavage/methylation domain-containing protein [Pyrinomonadaceae bacterium]|nr:prepilin-type N-terminal cleavage/methylation domain-containing protein [Pyrinomonadaceae bacterium]
MVNQYKSERMVRAMHKKETGRGSDERGFTLLETVIAFLIVMIAALGVVSVFAYAVNYNSGGNNRLQAITIAQQQLEQLRTAKFNAPVNGVSKTDASLAAGTTTTNVTGADGRPFSVTVVIDDNPFSTGVQTDTSSTIKEITITVTPTSAGSSWALNGVTMVTRRARTN